MADRRNTIQKEIIYRTLCQMGNHPTAAMVYSEVHRAHPTISRSTVYRVLSQMAAEGACLRLGLAGGDDRYDGDTSRHSHIRRRRTPPGICWRTARWSTGGSVRPAGASMNSNAERRL